MTPDSAAAPTHGPAAAAYRFVDAGLRGASRARARCLRHDAVVCGRVGVVASFVLDSAMERGDTALVVARYTETGSLVRGAQGPRYEPAPDSLARTRADTLVVIRSTDGWRVAGAAPPPLAWAKLVLSYFDLADGDGERIARDAGLDWTPVRRPVSARPEALGALSRRGLTPRELAPPTRRR